MKTIITVQDVAAAAHVSSATVSRVLNDSPLVTKKTSEVVRKAMADLGYRPNIIARGLRAGATKTVGIIITNVLNPFFAKIVRGIEDVVSLSGYSVIICNTDESEKKEVEYIRNLIDRKVDGLIIAGSGKVASYEDLLEETPAVFIDRIPNSAQAREFDSVIVDNEQGAYLLTKTLIDMGKRRIGLLASDVVTTGLDRIRGYRRAMEDGGLEIPDGLIEISDYLGKDTIEIANKLVESGADAIFAGNNIILMSVLQALKDAKPTDGITIATFDQTDWLSFIRARVVIASQPIGEIVEKSADILLRRMAGEEFNPQRIVLPIEVKMNW